MRRNCTYSSNNNRGDPFNVPKMVTAFNLANPNRDVSNIQHHAHLDNRLISPNELGRGFFFTERKAKK
jgi:hypothetical protein